MDPDQEASFDKMEIKKPTYSVDSYFNISSYRPYKSFSMYLFFKINFGANLCPDSFIDIELYLIAGLHNFFFFLNGDVKKEKHNVFIVFLVDYCHIIFSEIDSKQNMLLIDPAPNLT